MGAARGSMRGAAGHWGSAVKTVRCGRGAGAVLQAGEDPGSCPWTGRTGRRADVGTGVGLLGKVSVPQPRGRAVRSEG